MPSATPAMREARSAHQFARATVLRAPPCVRRARWLAVAVSLAAHGLALALVRPRAIPQRAHSAPRAEVAFAAPAQRTDAWPPLEPEPERSPELSREEEQPRLVESEGIEPVAPPEARAPRTAPVAMALFDFDRAARRLRALAPLAPRPAPVAVAAASPDPSREPARTSAAAHFEPARLISSTAPRYPRASVLRGESGTVLLRIDVAADGSVADVHVESSSGFLRLDEAAEDAAYAWTFEPAHLGGVAVASKLHHRVTFRLDRA